MIKKIYINKIVLSQYDDIFDFSVNTQQVQSRLVSPAPLTAHLLGAQSSAHSRAVAAASEGKTRNWQ